MKQFCVHLACLTIFCLLVSPLRAQEYHVQHFNAASGLSDNSVSDVHQDRFGYLWVTTAHGLNLYNGHDFRIFRYDPEDSFSIRANSMSNLYEDPESNIWISLSIGGVSKYDRFQDRFTYHTANPERGQDPNNFIQAILVDHVGRTWIGTSTHINLLNEATGLYVPVPIEGKEEDYALGIYEDAQGTIWLGTESGLFKYDEQQKRFTEFFDQKGKAIAELIRFVEDGEGKLWAASPHYVYSLEEAAARQVEAPSQRYITNIFLAGEGQVYISQYEDQVYRWTTEGWQVPAGFKSPKAGLRYAHADDGGAEMMVADNQRGFFLFSITKGSTEPLGMLNERIRSFWYGKDSRELWLGSPETGLFRVDLSPKMARHQKVSENKNVWVSSMVQTSDSEALIAEGGMLYRLQTQSRSFEPFMKRQLRNLGVSMLQKESENSLMMLTNNGMARLDLASERVQLLSGLDLKGSFDFRVANDSLWSIGEYGLALSRMSTNETQYFRDLEYLPEIFRNGEIRALSLDHKGNLWVGTVREGLIKLWFDRTVGRFMTQSYRYGGVRKGPFKSHTVNAILEDSQHRLWVGGFSSGLLEFDLEAEKFINRNPQGQVPIPHINALIEAADGSLWLSAKNGVHRYDPEDESFHQYSTRDGLSEAPFVHRSGAVLADNLLAFGTEAGITFFEPQRFISGRQSPDVLLESFMVESSDIALRLPEQEEPLKLKYNQNFVSFDFIALDYQDPAHVSYQYRLKGLQEEWKTIKHRHVQYANLGPGTYTFEVRAGLEAGNWNEQATSFEFYVHKPFWWQTWFLAMVALLLMLAILVVNKVRMNMKLSRIKALEAVRQNAAADFHDEMGNKLTRISLFSEVLEKKLNGTSPEISSYVKKIKDNSHVLNNSMRDFLWALDPDKDTTFDLIVMLKDFGDELFDNSGIEFHVESIREVFRDYPLDMDWKRHLIMIFKEAMHNVLKHSQARKVTLKASLSKDVMNLSLTDNGQGFSLSKKNGGYGHANMKRRADELGASISIESKEGEGTVVTFIGALSKKYETYD